MNLPNDVAKFYPMALADSSVDREFYSILVDSVSFVDIDFIRTE